MLIRIGIGLGCLFTAVAAVGAEEPLLPAALTLPSESWRLAWQDEFDGPGLDTSKWSIGLPWTGTDGTNRHHNDQYASYICDEDVQVADGLLKLICRRHDTTGKNGKVFRFTEGLITTANTFRQRYGYFEIRARVPVEAGPGMWPAFWTLADGWPPEMDIAEFWTSNNRFHQGYAYRNPEGKVAWAGGDRHDPLPTGWHSYGMEWGPGYQHYLVDGQIERRIYGEIVTAEPHYILLNSGVESGRPPTAATVFPNSFEVDYCRVWAHPGIPQVHNAGFELPALNPWRQAAGRGAVIAYATAEGQQAWRFDGPGRIEQSLFGLEPGRRYRLSGAARLAAGQELSLGVDEDGGAALSGEGDGAAWRRLSVDFTAAEDGPSVVYVKLHDGGSQALLDDVRIEALPAA